MSLVNCKECGAQMSDKAGACPACGYVAPKKPGMVAWSIGILMVLFLSIPAFSLGANSKPTMVLMVLAGLLFLPIIRLNVIFKALLAFVMVIVAMEYLPEELKQELDAKREQKRIEEANRPKTEKELAREQRNREMDTVFFAKKSVKSLLKDADSAKFKDVVYQNHVVPVACGYVNSKNSFGAYGGFKMFVSSGTPDMTFVEEGVEDFHNVWNKFCAGEK